MNHMSLSSSKKIRLITAGILSLLAQGIFLIPSRMEFVLPYFPRWGSVAIGVALFAISLLFFFNVIRSVNLESAFRWGTNETLLAIQAVMSLGLILLLESSTLRLREAGYLLSTVITGLVILGIFQNASPAQEQPGRHIEKEQARSVLMLDPSTNINALNEQITVLTHQLTAEKRRTTQLTLLNELSQQLEAELDPPVAAQLAVNTLERAMDCSIAALMMYETENQEYVVT
jgi:hypothetical protein